MKKKSQGVQEHLWRKCSLFAGRNECKFWFRPLKPTGDHQTQLGRASSVCSQTKNISIVALPRRPEVLTVNQNSHKFLFRHHTGWEHTEKQAIHVVIAPIPSQHSGTVSQPNSRTATKAWCEPGQLRESHQHCRAEGSLAHAHPSAPVFPDHSPRKATWRMGKGSAASNSLAQASRHRNKEKPPNFEKSAATLLSGLASPASPEHSSNDPSSEAARTAAAAPLLMAAI